MKLLTQFIAMLGMQHCPGITHLVPNDYSYQKYQHICPSRYGSYAQRVRKREKVRVGGLRKVKSRIRRKNEKKK